MGKPLIACKDTDNTFNKTCTDLVLAFTFKNHLIRIFFILTWSTPCNSKSYHIFLRQFTEI